MADDRRQPVDRPISWALLVLAGLVAVAAIVLLAADPGRPGMWFTLAGAVITMYLNVRTLRSDSTSRR